MATRLHNPDIWMADQRPILQAQLVGDDGVFDRLAECSFERFERPGEMAMIPYLRATYRGKAYEAPLRNWAWVAFGEVEA